MMSTARRQAILAAYERRSRRFDEIAAHSLHPTGVFPTPEYMRQEDVRTALSIRELEVLSLIASGLSNREVSLRLKISEETVKTHVQHTLRALGARNRAHAVSLGYAQGLLQDKHSDAGPGPSASN